MGGVNVVLERDIGSITALRLFEGAECESIVLIRVRSGASPGRVASLGTVRILAACCFGLIVPVKRLRVSSNEAEVVALLDALSALEVSRVGGTCLFSEGNECNRCIY